MRKDLVILFFTFLSVNFLLGGYAIAGIKEGANCQALIRGFIDVNDTTLYYEMKGCGEAVVLVHGMTLDTRMWDRQFRFLSQHYKVIRLDLRGHGRSAGISPESPYWYHEDLRCLLDSLGIESAHLIGLSMGACVVVDFAVSYPERVLSLVHADGTISGYSDWSQEFWERWLVYFNAWETLPIEEGLELWLQDPMFAYILATPGAGRHFEKIIRDHAEQGEGAYFSTNWYFSMPAFPFATDRLDSIDVPVLIFFGEHDLIEFKNCAAILYDGINTPPDQKYYVEIPGAGHMTNMERPHFINHLIFQFLASIE